MNARRLISAMCFFVFVSLAICGSVSAEYDGAWCSGVKVLEAGASSTSKLIYVMHQRTDCGSSWPPNTPRWFVLDESGSNASAMLATALTAQATGNALIIIGKDKLYNDWGVVVHVSSSSR